MSDDLMHKAGTIAVLFFLSILMFSTIHGWTAIAAGLLGLIGIAIAVRVLSGWM